MEYDVLPLTLLKRRHTIIIVYPKISFYNYDACMLNRLWRIFCFVFIYICVCVCVFVCLNMVYHFLEWSFNWLFIYLTKIFLGLWWVKNKLKYLGNMDSQNISVMISVYWKTFLYHSRNLTVDWFFFSSYIFVKV